MLSVGKFHSLSKVDLGTVYQLSPVTKYVGWCDRWRGEGALVLLHTASLFTDGF
jgi:hypothetical protein